MTRRQTGGAAAAPPASIWRPITPAASAGSIIIREGEKQVQPVKQLNRDTKNSLQKLATIFDKEKVQEKQELVNELSKVGTGPSMNWPHGKAGRKAVMKRSWPTAFSEGCSVPWQAERSQPDPWPEVWENT